MREERNAVPRVAGSASTRMDMGQAVAEANRCLMCHDAPCSNACPAGTDPATFLRKLRLQNVTGAIRTIRRNNILGGACGDLCPTPRLCERECVAAGLDRPIRIGLVQRFLVEHGFRIGFQPLVAGPPRRERVAVVGSGPAGLSCAAGLAQGGFWVTVFESRPEPGGVLRYGVPAHRLSVDLFRREVEDIARLGVTFACGTAVRGPGAVEGLLESGFAAVFLAPGIQGAARLEIGPVPASGVWAWTEFLAGVRDGREAAIEAAVRGRRVVVFGGGSVAIDCAMTALRLGATDVFLSYRRSYVEMPAEEEEKVCALRAGMHLLVLCQPTGYVADGEGRLRAVRLVRTELAGPDASGRRQPVAVPGSGWDLPVDVAVEAIGARPGTDVLDWGDGIRRRGAGLIAVSGESGATSIDGAYAGGDIVRGPGLVVEAVRDGKLAAAAIAARLGAAGGAA